MTKPEIASKVEEIANTLTHVSGAGIAQSRLQDMAKVIRCEPAMECDLSGEIARWERHNALIVDSHDKLKSKFERTCCHRDDLIEKVRKLEVERDRLAKERDEAIAESRMFQASQDKWIREAHQVKADFDSPYHPLQVEIVNLKAERDGLFKALKQLKAKHDHLAATAVASAAPLKFERDQMLITLEAFLDQVPDGCEVTFRGRPKS